MRIRFTHDFRGKATQELFFLAGEELDVDEDTGRHLIALDHAVEVETFPPPAPTSKPEPAHVVPGPDDAIEAEPEAEDEDEQPEPRRRKRK